MAEYLAFELVVWSITVRIECFNGIIRIGYGKYGCDVGAFTNRLLGGLS